MDAEFPQAVSSESIVAIKTAITFLFTIIFSPPEFVMDLISYRENAGVLYVTHSPFSC